MKQEDEAFLKQSKKLLDESVDSLDAATLSRLNQARQKALAVRHTGRFFTARTVTVSASLVVATVVAILWTSTPPQSTLLAQQYEDLEMLTADADLDLLEDLEFVSWLVEADPDAVSPGSVPDASRVLNDAG